jgi:glutathione S-transferase
MTMLKLYYTPGAWSLATHIILREVEEDFELIRVDLASGKTELGDTFTDINPKGYVPALLFEDGQLMTESQVILQFLADQKPSKGLAPRQGDWARYRLMEWLAFIATELHKGFGPLWNPNTPGSVREQTVAQLEKRLDYVEKNLRMYRWLSGADFGIGDAYLFTVLNWAGMHQIDLARWPHVQAYYRKIAERPTVQAAMRAEGLIP